MDLGSKNPMHLTHEAIHAAASEVFGRVVAWLSDARSRPAVRVPGGDLTTGPFSADLPEDGRALPDILDELESEVMPWGVNLAHPRFFAFIPCPGNPIGSLGDALASAYNPFVGTWLGGSGPSALEARMVAWLGQSCGYAASSGGLLTSGGSLANLTAISAARLHLSPDSVDSCTMYVGDSTHYSCTRAMRAAGISRRNVRVVPGGAGGVFDVERLRESMENDLANGLLPVCVVASAGTTGTGGVDPVGDIADVCEEHNVWLHVDGAFGAAAAISPRLRPQLGSIERSDSISIDPHKWLFQPIDIGCLVVRAPEKLHEAFRDTPDYLREVHEAREVNYADIGLELTRGFRALKLWLTVQFFGLRKIRRAVENGVELAEYAEGVLRETPGVTVSSPASLGIVTFRFTRKGDGEAGDGFNADVTARAIATGEAMVSTTRVAGRTVLRLCTINPASTRDDVDETVALLERLSRSN